MSFAGLLCDADLFAITSGAVVPVDLPMLEDVLTDVLACRHSDPEHIGDELRFAVPIYRDALDAGCHGLRRIQPTKAPPRCLPWEDGHGSGVSSVAIELGRCGQSRNVHVR